METKPANQNTQTSHHSTFRGFPGDPLFLDKQTQLASIFLQEGKGESPAWDAQGQDPNLQSPCLELQSHAWPCHNTGTPQDLLKSSCSDLGGIHSSESDVSSMRHLSPGKCSSISLASSGYVGDKENSEVSLVGSGRVSRLSRGLSNQAGSTQTNHLCATYSSVQLKGRQTGQANSCKQTGGENQTGSCQTSRVNSNVQSGLDSSNTSLQEDKAQDNVKNSSQIIEGKQLPRCKATWAVQGLCTHNLGQTEGLPTLPK
ncbi:protein TNT [Elephas maximus indicus]|uniref:protein TNT n=1 Tax=Elephas maximus indicus TaxID=99487 RepID=UPI0021167B20|nr:protein TNT [Elephas maximus indicus]